MGRNGIVEEPLVPANPHLHRPRPVDPERVLQSISPPYDCPTMNALVV